MAKGIHIGIGGWTYEPWRGTFYPPGLTQARELEHAATRVTAIEINGTYYGSQKPKTFQKWADSVPDDFIFTIKASRFCTNRRVLAEGAESVEKFLGQGLDRLGEKLGPILWQFMATKQFDPDDFGYFLKLLPAKRDGMKLRHAIEVRHESFRDPRFIDMVRDAGAAVVFADSTEHPCIADPTADFIYARLQNAQEDEPTGYSPADLDRWAKTMREWAKGPRPEGFDYVTEAGSGPSSRDVFLFMINGAKVRAPAAAEALIARLS